MIRRSGDSSGEMGEVVADSAANGRSDDQRTPQCARTAARRQKLEESAGAVWTKLDQGAARPGDLEARPK